MRCALTQPHALFAQRIADTELRLDRKSEILYARFPNFVERGTRSSFLTSGVEPKPGRFRTDFEADLCVQFIRKSKNKPFFLMLAPFAVHIPLASKAALIEKYRARAGELGRELPHPICAAMVEEVDALVGQVVDEIEAQGLTDNTMIVPPVRFGNETGN